MVGLLGAAERPFGVDDPLFSSEFSGEALELHRVFQTVNFALQFAPNIFVPPLEVGRYNFHLGGMGEQWGPRPLVPESGTSIPPELVFRPAIIHKINHPPVAVTTGEAHLMEIFRRRRGS
jgi:hypothetical protein